MIEDAAKDERVAKYSGRVITAEAASRSNSAYLFQVNKTTVLDAEDPRYREGRFVNDGPHAGRPANCRFGAALKTTIDPDTGHEYISIFATKDIKASPKNPCELLIDYGGKCYWPPNQTDKHAVPALMIRRRPPKKMLARERAQAPPSRVYRRVQKTADKMNKAQPIVAPVPTKSQQQATTRGKVRRYRRVKQVKPTAP